MPQYKNTPTLLYVTNGKSHITYYDNYNFIIPIYEYENQNTVVISVVSSYYDEKSPQDYEMYVNVIEASIIDKIPYNSEEMNNYLPDLNNHQIEGKGCIILNKEKLIHNNDYYILVHVLGSGFIELLVSANINANNLFIPFVTNPTFFYIPPSEKINSMFYIYGEKKLNFTIIKGNGKYDYLPEKLTNISIESTSSEEGFGLYVYEIITTLYTEDITMNGMKSVGENKFPILLTLKAENIEPDPNHFLQVNLKIYSFRPCPEVNLSIKGTFTNEKFIDAYRVNQHFQPAIPFKSGYYFPNQNNAVLNIKVTNTSEPYLFVVIEAHFGITGSVGMCVFACVNN